MRAAIYTSKGPAVEVLRVVDKPVPEPGAGEVRVRVAFSGVNPSDVKSRAGVASRAGGFPEVTPHSDGAGTIDKLGAGVDATLMGRRVWIFNGQWERPFGTAAEHIVLPVSQVVPLPDDISFEVMPGEVVGFLGPNGAGKSTTLKMITGYLPKDTGNIFVCGIPVEGEAISTKKKIGYLAESNPLYHEMYVREYLQFIGELHRVSNIKSRVDEVVLMTGLSAEMHKEIGQLSKGYKQRVGLAAALIHDPEVLILDEPTTGLDPNQIIEIREVIRSLGKKKTILFSSHILQEVESLCDRVIVINKGKIVADDRIEKLRDIGSASTLRVQLKDKATKNIFENIPGLLKIEQIDEHNWVFQTSDAEKLSKELIGFTLQHSLNIVSLQTQTRSLEDIFRELTGEMN